MTAETASTDLPYIPPRQARSRETMERVLVATEQLLGRKSFDEITIAEIARAARTSPPSIYARFTGKNGILLAVHERFKDASIARLREIFDSPDVRSARPEAIFRCFAESLARSYAKNRELIRSALLADDAAMYTRGTDLFATGSEILEECLRPSFIGPDTGEACRRLDFAVRLAAGALQQELIFRTSRITRYEVEGAELVDRLVDMYTGLTAGFIAGPDGTAPA